MVRGLRRSLLTSLIVALLVAAVSAGRQDGSAFTPTTTLQRFLALDDPSPSHFRALRHLDASNEKLQLSAWMDVWTELDGRGFRYTVVGEGGSDSIRTKVFREMLDSERRIWATNGHDKASMSPANYVFAEPGAVLDGMASIGVKPRRKEALLIDGAIFLRDDGELLRMEGELARPPSFWTRQVRIVRQFQRFAGVRLPVSLDVSANLRIFGRSSFRAVYEYETVNAERVGTPQLRAAER